MRLGFDARKVIDALQTVIPRCELHGHHDSDVGMAEQDTVNDCFRGGLTDYSFIEAFESRIAEVAGTKYAFATCNGTAALHLALMAAGVKPGDAVLVPSMAFVAAANAIVHCGAVPVFLDSEDDSFGIMPYKLQVFIWREVRDGTIGAHRVAALIAVHVLGKPCRIDEIVSICLDHRIPVIEDAAEAFGSRFKDRPCGSFGSAATFSFNCNKIVTTGGGGAVVTDSKALHDRVRRLGTTARVPHWFEVAHDEVAWNYRMPNVCAAIGLAQTERLPQMMSMKRKLAHAYQGALMGVPGVQFVQETPGAESNCWLSALRVDPRWKDGREEIASAMNDAAIFGRALFTPLHTLPMYRNHLADNPLMAIDAHKRTICLPSGVALARRFA